MTVARYRKAYLNRTALLLTTFAYDKQVNDSRIKNQFYVPLDLFSSNEFVHTSNIQGVKAIHTYNKTTAGVFLKQFSKV